MSCIPLIETFSAVAEPSLFESACILKACLGKCFSPTQIEDIIHLLDEGEVVGRLVSHESARQLGFYEAIQ